MGKKVFRMDYYCRNCSKNWLEDYEAGNSIIERIFQAKVILSSNKCTGNIGCHYCKTIECPVCKSENISIKKRSPACCDCHPKEFEYNCFYADVIIKNGKFIGVQKVRKQEKE